MLLLAVKTSWVRKIVGEKMEDFEEETIDLRLACECECDSVIDRLSFQIRGSRSY